MGRKNEDDFGGTEKKVRRLLGELGIPRTGQGFSVVADAVVMALESEEVYGSLTKEIYPEIAKKRGKSADFRISEGLPPRNFRRQTVLRFITLFSAYIHHKPPAYPD